MLYLISRADSVNMIPHVSTARANDFPGQLALSVQSIDDESKAGPAATAGEKSPIRRRGVERQNQTTEAGMKTGDLVTPWTDRRRSAIGNAEITFI